MKSARQIASPPGPTTSLRELAGVFLKLGTIAFGGPAAHVALMEEEAVRRRQWITREEFLDFLGATNLIPGPNSTELAIHIGRARAGWSGLLVAGSCFILPATLIVGVLAWVYTRFGTLPGIGRALYGIKPIVIAIVLQALWTLGRSAVKSYRLAVVGLAAVAATVLGVHELIVLAAAAVLTASIIDGGSAGGMVRPRANPTAWRAASAGRGRPDQIATTAAVVSTAAPWPLSTAGLTATASAAAAPAAPVSLGLLFGVFVKIGAVLFGSGYVLLAILRADLVDRFGWLTERQLLDAVAVGQMTPGPVFTTATFVGYLVAGAPGAAVATIAIFLPAFVFVALSGPLVPLIRRSRVAGAALDGVNVASLALMAVVTWQLGRAAVIDLPTFMLATASAVLLVSFRMNSAWLVGIGALSGLLVGP